MNKAQKIVLILGVLLIIISIFSAPYQVEKYDRFRGKELETIWIEYHLVFTPPLEKDELEKFEYDRTVQVNFYKEGRYQETKGKEVFEKHFYPLIRKRDWILQGSILFAEAVVLTMILFIFITRKSK